MKAGAPRKINQMALFEKGAGANAAGKRINRAKTGAVKRKK